MGFVLKNMTCARVCVKSATTPMTYTCYHFVKSVSYVHSFLMIANANLTFGLYHTAIDEVPTPVLIPDYVEALAKIDKIPENWKNMNLSYRCNVKKVRDLNIHFV